MSQSLSKTCTTGKALEMMLWYMEKRPRHDAAGDSAVPSLCKICIENPIPEHILRHSMLLLLLIYCHTQNIHQGLPVFEPESC